MYVCICNAVTDKQIRRAAASGVHSLRELQQYLGVAATCGSCADQAQSILNETSQSRAQPSIYYPATA